MLLLLDECLPKLLKREFVGHVSVTVPEAGLAGLKNGALLASATQSFDVFITVDTNLRFQQNLSGLALRIVVLRAISNDMSDLKPLVPKVLAVIPTLPPGAVIEIGA
jgi:hypothetical protein